MAQFKSTFRNAVVKKKKRSPKFSCDCTNCHYYIPNRTFINKLQDNCPVHQNTKTWASIVSRICKESKVWLLLYK